MRPKIADVGNGGKGLSRARPPPCEQSEPHPRLCAGCDDLLPQQLGHLRIEQTIQYARFHQDYGDVKEYFERVEKPLGLSESGNTLGNTPETSPEPSNPVDL